MELTDELYNSFIKYCKENCNIINFDEEGCFLELHYKNNYTYQEYPFKNYLFIFDFKDKYYDTDSKLIMYKKFKKENEIISPVESTKTLIRIKDITNKLIRRDNYQFRYTLFFIKNMEYIRNKRQFENINQI